MSTNVRDLRDTIIPKSDQLNAEQLLSGPITITVTDVRRGGGEEQPIIIHYEGDGGRPYKPCKSMRKVLVFAWGIDGREWIGRSMTIYNRPDVKFGGEEVGGIRISHMSNIDRDIAISLTATRGRKEQTRIKRLDEASTVQGSRARLEAAARGGMENLKSAWASLPNEHKSAIGGTKGCPADLKNLAMQSDSSNAGMEKQSSEEVYDGDFASKDLPPLTVDDVRQRMIDAKTEDELNLAWDLLDVEKVESTKEQHKELGRFYTERMTALQA